MEFSDTPSLFNAKPSMRRAFFYAIIYSAALLYGFQETNFDPRFNSIWLGFAGVLCAILVVVFIRRACTSYQVFPDEVRTATGIFARRLVVVPINRITNFHGNQSVLERVLGLVNLQIDCAGGDSKEVAFRRILKEEAKQVSQILKERRTFLAQAGQPTPI